MPDGSIDCEIWEAYVERFHDARFECERIGRENCIEPAKSEPTIEDWYDGCADAQSY